MSNVLIITASDIKFKPMCDMLVRSIKQLRYHQYHVFDLGGLGYGEKFSGKFQDKEGAKIPCKPEMIKRALERVNDNDFVVWMDADTILWDNLNSIKDNYDIGVTIRGPKFFKDQPCNAGVCMFRKTPKTLQFIDTWISMTEQGHSDQREMNRFLRGNMPSDWENKIIEIEGAQFKLFPCKIYNNWGFKKPQLHAKITHYKSSRRLHWPKRVIGKPDNGKPLMAHRFPEDV